MDLEPEEPCCICYIEMKEDEALTFCKFGCGRNIHIDCIGAWCKHKLSTSNKITCPLCRTDWGSNALEELKAETRQHKQKIKDKKTEEAKAKSVRAIV